MAANRADMIAPGAACPASRVSGAAIKNVQLRAVVSRLMFSLLVSEFSGVCLMKTLIASLCAGAAMLALPVMASADEARTYDNGPVWNIAYIQTKAGHFDDYMKFVSTSWKAEQEALKAKGLVLDYKVLAPQDPRDNEADLILMIEYKNMAAFDVPLDDMDAVTKKLSGSITAANKAYADRETIRVEKGQVLTRELVLK
jgi:hypothetical protein